MRFIVWLAFNNHKPKETSMNTEIILPVPELKTALSGLNKIVNKKSTLPVLSCVKVSRNKNGEVSLQGTDLDAHATFTFNNTQAGEAVDLLVPLEQLNKAAKSSSSDSSLALICEDKTTRLRYYIGGNPVHQPVYVTPMKEWPEWPQITTESTPLQPGFGEALKQAMQCCSQDGSRYNLCGACLDARDPKAHYIVGTNGRFMYSANSFTFPMKDAVIIPDSKFINGPDLLNGETCMLAIQPVPVKKAGAKPPGQAAKAEEVPPKLVSLQSGQWQFVTKEIDGIYPNWKQVVPTINGDYTLIKLSETAIKQLLKVLPNLPGQDGYINSVRLRTSGIWLNVEGKNKDDQEYTSVTITDVTITGKPKQICLNRNYLLPALKFGLDELAILDELTGIVASKEGKKMVIMPIRLDGPAPQPEPSTPAVSTSTSTTTTTATTTATSTPPASAQPTAEVQPQAEAKESTMAKTSTKTETAPEPEQEYEPLKPTTPTPLIDQVEAVKDTLRNAIRDLNRLADIVKQTEKQQRANEKEVETARTVLKKLQQVTI